MFRTSQKGCAIGISPTRISPFFGEWGTRCFKRPGDEGASRLLTERRLSNMTFRGLIEFGFCDT